MKLVEKRKCHYTTIQKHLKKKNCKSEHKTAQIKATSTRIRIRWKRILDIWELKHGGGWENVTYSITFNLSNVGGSTRIRYAIYISSLLASRHAQTEPVMWFRGIFECCCYFEYHDQACLYVVPPGRHFFALDEPKSSLTRFRVKTFYTPLSRRKRFHNLDAD